MRIVIPGGSGQVGTILAREFHARGHEVIVLSRRPPPARWKSVPWNPNVPGAGAREIDGADVVINLAGRSVNCRYTAANRRAIMESRTISTRAVGRAIAQASRPPRVWLQASTATIYAHRLSSANDEETGTIGGREEGSPPWWKFSIDVAQAWERECTEAQTPRTRKVLMRSAMTMSPDRGGVFDALLWLVRRGLGGTAGDGTQYVSWIHDQDFIRAVDWLIEHEDLSGPVNLCSPNPLPNDEFMRNLRDTWGARFGLPAKGWILEMGAVLMRTETELILKSRRVSPRRLLDSGFEFEFEQWPAAAADLVRRWREARG